MWAVLLFTLEQLIQAWQSIKRKNWTNQTSRCASPSAQLWVDSGQKHRQCRDQWFRPNRGKFHSNFCIHSMAGGKLSTDNHQCWTEAIEPTQHLIEHEQILWQSICVVSSLFFLCLNSAKVEEGNKVVEKCVWSVLKLLRSTKVA